MISLTKWFFNYTVKTLSLVDFKYGYYNVITICKRLSTNHSTRICMSFKTNNQSIIL